MLAAPAVRRFLEEALPYIGVQPVYTEEELAKTTISVPNLVGSTLSQAKATINSKGLKVTYVGEGDTVVKTVPSGGNIHMTGDSTTKTATAVSQSIAEGATVSVGTVVDVAFQANVARE